MPRVLLSTMISMLFFACWQLLLQPSPVIAGDYLDSAHGSSEFGVFRPIIGNPPPSGFGYSRGNCSHCHEQHASINGTQPPPGSGNASPYVLFAENFNSARKTPPYAESDNFCFSCHNNPSTAQPVLNNDYSQAFGCGPQGPSTIIAAMNQTSAHNLYDLWTFNNSTFPWSSTYSNPCNSCHNPHLARRNWASAQDPEFSAISKPNDHFVLFGSTETMESSYNTKYEPPYCSNSLVDREPGASGNAISGRANTPDYVAFCSTCHNNSTTIFSTTLSRDLIPINWNNNGDKHGLRPMDGSVSTLPPYDIPASGTDFVLSCLDCHEAHGSENVMLLRRRANGSDLTAAITSLDTIDWGLLCLKCHEDDVAAGISLATSNKWEYVHHLVSDAPYAQIQCNKCHISTTGGGGGPPAIPCQQCHSHSGIVTKTDQDGVLRIGF